MIEYVADIIEPIQTNITDINSNITTIQQSLPISLSKLGITATASEINKLDGCTATTTELNRLHGLTATTSELNRLDGITATVTELNYTDGVTSNIQTQLNGKAAASHNHAASNITSGTLPVARGGTGYTAMYTTGSFTATACSVSSSRVIRFYNNTAFVGLNIRLKSPLYGDSSREIGKVSPTPTRSCPLACIGYASGSPFRSYDLHARVDTDGTLDLFNSGNDAFSCPTNATIMLGGIIIL